MRIASGLRGGHGANLSPLGGEARLLGQSIVEQNRELLGFQWVERHVLIFGHQRMRPCENRRVNR